jgi:transposase
MRQANKRTPESAEKTVRDIRRATRWHHSAEEKIHVVLEGLRGEDPPLIAVQAQTVSAPNAR